MKWFYLCAPFTLKAVVLWLQWITLLLPPILESPLSLAERMHRALVKQFSSFMMSQSCRPVEMMLFEEHLSWKLGDPRSSSRKFCQRDMCSKPLQSSVLLSVKWGTWSRWPWCPLRFMIRVTLFPSILPRNVSYLIP